MDRAFLSLADHVHSDRKTQTQRLFMNADIAYLLLITSTALLMGNEVSGRPGAS